MPSMLPKALLTAVAGAGNMFASFAANERSLHPIANSNMGKASDGILTLPHEFVQLLSPAV